MTSIELNVLEEMRREHQTGWAQAYQHAIDERDFARRERDETLLRLRNVAEKYNELRQVQEVKHE